MVLAWLQRSKARRLRIGPHLIKEQKAGWCLSSQRLYELGQLRLVVSGFVLVDDVLLSQTVQHRRNLLELRLSSRSFGGGAQLLDGRAGRFGLVTVQDALSFVGTDALKGGFMVCHEG